MYFVDIEIADYPPQSLKKAISTTASSTSTWVPHVPVVNLTSVIPASYPSPRPRPKPSKPSSSPQTSYTSQSNTNLSVPTIPSLDSDTSLDSDSSIEFVTLPLGSVAQRKWTRCDKDRLEGLSSEQLWEHHIAARTELTLVQENLSLPINQALDSDSSLEFVALPLGSVAQRQWGRQGKDLLKGISLEQLWEHHLDARTELTPAQEVPQPEAGPSQIQSQMHLTGPVTAHSANPANQPQRRAHRRNKPKKGRTSGTEEGDAESRYNLGVPAPRVRQNARAAAEAATGEISRRPSMQQEGSFLQPVNTVRNQFTYCMNSFLALTSL